jgi:hypothetical protein
MKCKFCNSEINLVIFGMLKDVCWDCANKKEVLDINIKEASSKPSMKEDNSFEIRSKE